MKVPARARDPARLDRVRLGKEGRHIRPGMSPYRSAQYGNVLFAPQKSGPLPPRILNALATGPSYRHRLSPSDRPLVPRAGGSVGRFGEIPCRAGSLAGVFPAVTPGPRRTGNVGCKAPSPHPAYRGTGK